MSTAFTKGKQITIFSKEQILNECLKADFVDCRINAYPVVEELNETPIHAPNIIFTDIDPSNNSDKEESLLQLNKTLSKSLNIIKKILNECRPTVLWPGNGFHIYTILDTRPLELIKELKELSPKPSEEFLKFAELTFSNNKNDSCHHPTFKSCLLRIPYTLNSKNINLEKGNKENSEVKIVQQFDKNNIPSITTKLLRSYRIWLADKSIQNSRIKAKRVGNRIKGNNMTRSNISNVINVSTNYFWLEKLLQTPIPSHRRYCLFRILSPYLINVKKLSYEESFSILEEWLDKCNNLSPLSFDSKSEIKSKLNGVKNYLPISLQKLNNENGELYNLIRK